MSVKRRIITIPADGVKQNFSFGGQALQVEFMNSYSGPGQVPLLYFQSETNNAQPLYSRGVYGAAEPFTKIWIEGTSESAGDQIYLLIFDFCKETDLEPDFAATYQAVAGTSFAVTTTDAAQQLSELQLIDADGNLPKSITVSALNNPIIYAFNVDPDRTTDFGHILHKNVITGGSEFNGSLLEIEGIDFILNWHFASAAAGSPAELTITPRY